AKSYGCTEKNRVLGYVRCVWKREPFLERITQFLFKPYKSIPISAKRHRCLFLDRVLIILWERIRRKAGTGAVQKKNLLMGVSRSNGYGRWRQ
ncbi:MAG: hypothetical protein K6U00_14980, partial [Armatimonadetes bacterium]|nr:hypothetical protein [Armatimonadota bacterium]